VFLAGLAFDFCVRYSAEDAAAAGFEVVVVEDACRGIDLNGSVADTRRMLGTMGIPLVGSADIVSRPARRQSLA
jgi:nicotinamidase/pyrazinamidase